MRFFRFRIRTLMIAVALSAIPFGWIAFQRSNMRRDEQLILKLASHLDVSIPVAQAGPCGYEVERVSSQLPWPNAGIALRTPVSPRWFPGHEWFPNQNHDMQMALFNRVYSIRLGGNAACSDAFHYISQFSELETLVLDQPIASDEEIRRFANANPQIKVRVSRKP